MSNLHVEQTYWSEHFHRGDAYVFYDAAEYDLIVRLLGRQSLKGKAILEVGCGSGIWTSNLQRLGADVFHFDLTASIVHSARCMAQVGPAFGFVADMHHLPFGDGAFDVVFGSMVIHHSYDHGWLGSEIARVTRAGGRAIFHENSARNPLLMLARSTLVGRFGVPKNSSPGEHPLRPTEVAAFGKAFNACEVMIGRMFLAQLAVKYLLKTEQGQWFERANRFDNWLYRALPPLRPLSYYQIVVCQK